MPSSKKRNRDLKRLTDQELMDLVQAGDFSPAAEIYERYSSRIYSFAYRFLRNSEAAEDITQEVFIKIMKRAAQFHGGSKLSTWLLAITANSCRDHLRKQENRPKAGEDVLIELPAPYELSPERHMERRDAERRIQEALTVLTPDQREAILLSRYQGLSYAEIAQVAGCSEGAVKTRVFRAMEVLKKALTGGAHGGDQCLTVMP
jgi:RNA polymerase sigma-70 factor, ECF subfamily